MQWNNWSSLRCGYPLVLDCGGCSCLLGFPVRPPGACPRTSGTGRLQMRPLRQPQRSRRGYYPLTVPQSPLRVCAPGARRLQPRPLCPLPRRHGSTLQHRRLQAWLVRPPPRRHRGFRYHGRSRLTQGGLQRQLCPPPRRNRGVCCHSWTLQHRRLQVRAQLPPRRHGRLRFYRATLPQRSFSVMTVATRCLQMQPPPPPWRRHRALRLLQRLLRTLQLAHSRTTRIRQESRLPLRR